MKRKLIKQGAGGLTFYVPKKWIDINDLNAGDLIEIGFNNENNNLTISPEKIKTKNKEITLKITKEHKSLIRTMIVNAYRSGFDKIIIEFDGSNKELNYVVDNFLIGFEVFKIKDNVYSIESMSEPSYDNFNNILNKQFFLISEMLNEIEGEDVQEYSHKQVRYDSFLRRCLSKGVYPHLAKSFLWQFLADLVHISRLCFHLNNEIINKKINLTKNNKEVLKKLKEMFNILRESYQSNNYLLLSKVHDIGNELVYNKSKEIIFQKDKIISYYLVLLSRAIYVANNPLMGVLQLNEFEKIKNKK